MKASYFILVLAFFFSSCQKEKVIFIADHFGECESQCLLVRENEQDKWSNFSENIEGFEYKEGYNYKLKVKIEKKNSKVTYSLVEILSKTKTTSTNTVENQEKWLVTKIEGFENKTIKTPSFTIKDNIIKGATGCNSFGGDLQFNKTGVFKVGKLRFTKMYCQEYMTLENAFSSALSKATHYKLIKGKMLFFNSENKLLFTAKKKVPLAVLESKWYITSIKGFQNKTNKIPYFRISKTFINGNNGCNDFGGNFSTDKSNSFKIDRLRKTQMYCEEFASVENAFHTALSQVTHYKITKGSLLLFDKSKYVVMTASKTKPIPESTTYSLPYTIEYNVFSKGYAINNKIVEAKHILEYADLLPKKTPLKTLTLSKTDLKLFRKDIQRIGIESLEKIQAPSKKYQYDGAPAATFTVTFNGKTYTVPTFDHGNPPKELKGFITRLMQIREEEYHHKH